MTPFAKHLHKSFQDALKLGPTLNEETPTSVLCEWEQSCRAENIARELAECGAFQLQQMPKPWKELTPETQGRFRMLAERVIRQIDPGVRERCKAEAVREITDWLAGPGNMKENGPTPEDIAREAIARYESLCSAGPAVTL